MLSAGVLEVATAALGIGVTLAKTLAQETSQGVPVPPPTDKDSPLNAAVHYSVAAATNVIKLVVSGVGVSTPDSVSTDKTAQTAPESPAATNPQRPSSLPVVHCGSALRIPHSIENPGAEPMNNMNIVCKSLEMTQPLGLGKQLDLILLSFQPDVLSIAPKDFEKLTVLIETRLETTVGDYIAVIAIGSDNFETTLKFRVVAAT